MSRKVALVTGGARGIGRTIAQDLAKDHDIAFTWHKSPADAAIADLPAALALQGDLTQALTCATLIDRIITHFGRLDVIVNNAGDVSATPLETHVREDHARLMALHVMAPAALLSAALPHLKRGAAIVSISSVNAVLPPMGAAMYGASKAALNLWTRAMAKELGPKGIRVNAVAPGAVNIPESPRDGALTKQFENMTALGALATPEDIAHGVRFLASQSARAITGEILTVSGGYRL